MSDDLLKFKQDVMDAISPTFCASKWYDAVIFLNEGNTKSCHHTQAHQINSVEVEFNPSALHNTDDKKEQRKQMMAGERPDACRYCWNAEDSMEDDVYADRIPYTRRFSDEDIQIAADSAVGWDSHLRTLEISFDRTCNFACSYCSPRFSTTWAKDIKKNGGYILRTNSPYYGNDGSEVAEPYGRYNEGNPYLEAFWKWWPELSQTLEQFRITGGEPIMSASFWRLVETIKREGVRDDMLISVNSNLGSKKSLISDLIDFTNSISRFSLFTSCEAHGDAAEYLRDGLDYDYWLKNISRVMTEGNVEQTTIMTTITAVALYSFTEFLDDILKLREAGDHNILISFNLLKAPPFMSVLILPEEMRDERATALEVWGKQNSERLSYWETNGVKKVVAFLREGADPLWTDDIKSRMSNELDFYLFYRQYDERRDKSFQETFPSDLVEWYEELADQYEEDINKYHKFRGTM